jgi:hypothetical protein
VYFGQPENSEQCVLSGYASLCIFHSWFRQRNLVVLHHTNIGRVIGEQQGYAVEITNERYMRASVLDNTRQSPLLGGFRTYPS